MTFRFNAHQQYQNSHAYLSASQHSWLNYTDQRMRDVFFDRLMAQRGTELHAFAERANKLGLKMPRNHQTINEFINDGLGCDMSSEVMLFYSPNCYGTADLIGYNEKKKLLRIFDLKTGIIPVKEFGQLHIYGALFCLEYGVNPEDISFEFRIYQDDEVKIDDSFTNEDIRDIMTKIVHFDNILTAMQEEALTNRGIA